MGDHLHTFSNIFHIFAYYEKFEVMKLNFYLTFVLVIIISSETIQSQDFTEANAYTWRGGKIHTDPAFYDLDYDGLIDILVGKQKGKIMHYKQQSVNSNQFFLVDRNFCNISYGGYTTTSIYDIDQDSMPDLFMCSAYNGVLIYEADTIGSLNFSWKAVGPDVGVFASPSVSDIDGDGMADLLIGEQMGVIYHFEQMDTPSLQFELITENFSNIDVGFRATPEISDLDNDGLLDLLTGNSDIGVSHYEQIQNNSYEFYLILKKEYLDK